MYGQRLPPGCRSLGAWAEPAETALNPCLGVQVEAVSKIVNRLLLLVTTSVFGQRLPPSLCTGNCFLDVWEEAISEIVNRLSLPLCMGRGRL